MNEARTILVVDDNEAILEFHERALSQKYTVVTAEDGEQAFEVLIDDRHEISLVVTDFDMPKLNGLDLIAKIRTECGGGIPSSSRNRVNG